MLVTKIRAKEIRTMTHDLTTGKPLRDIWQFAVPVLFGLLLQQVYSLVDTAIVGHALGVMALGGVGATGSVNFLVIGFCGGLCTGMAIPLAQAFGAGDYRQLRRYVAGCVWLGIAMSALLLALTLPTTQALLKLMGTPEEQMGYAYDYIFIIFIGIPATILYNMGACVLRSLGDSKSPVWFLAIASVINIVLDLLTVCVLGMGVAGAALASLASRVLAAVIVTKLICHKSNPIHVNRLFHFEWNGDILRRILGIGVPNGMENGVFQVGKLVVSNLIAGLSTSVIAANAICNTVSGLVCVPGNAIGLALITVVGQCVGARAIREAQTNVKKLMFFTYGCMLVLNVFLFFLAAPVVALFDLSELATTISIDLLKQYAVFNSIFWPLSFPFANALRAAGDAKYTMWTSIGSMVLIRVGLSYLFILGPMDMGIYGVWNAMYVDWIVRIAFFLPRYLKGKWKTMSAV